MATVVASVGGFFRPVNLQSMQEEQRLSSSREPLLGEPEPWQSWETQLVLWSIAIGISGLLSLGWLVNHFLLS